MEDRAPVTAAELDTMRDDAKGEPGRLAEHVLRLVGEVELARRERGRVALRIGVIRDHLDDLGLDVRPIDTFLEREEEALKAYERR